LEIGASVLPASESYFGQIWWERLFQNFFSHSVFPLSFPQVFPFSSLESVEVEKGGAGDRSPAPPGMVS
jgi:hypothetical protein